MVPGILVRQCFDESDIGRPKAQALGDRLRRVDSQLEAEALASNLLYLLDDPSPFSDVDIIIDCTASQPVRTKAERVLRSEGVRPPIASLGIGFDASSAIATLSMPGHSGGTLDLLRRLKIAACRDPSVLGALRDTFWPSEGDPARFQPEPGCSEPTFVGSDADLASLSARAMNAIANALRSHDQPSAAAGWMFSGGGELHEFGWSSELVLDDPSHEFSIRISPEALREMRGWARRSERTAGRDCETGGLIFGELSEAAGVLWVTEVAGPPPDSDASALHFTCGVEGMEEAAAEKEGRFRKSVRCVGSWHTHPRSRAEPSEVDIGAVYQLLATPGSNRRTCLLLILSGSPDDPTMGAHLFRTERRLQNSVVVSMDASSTSGISNDVTSPRDVGLALSGGGSRAIAFHLGCLRALADLDLLDRLQVISSVSGGSVIAAMYAYSSEDFADFDARVTSLLREGLVGEIAKAWLTPGSMARTAAAMLRNVPSSMLRGLGAMLPSGLQRGLLDPRSVPPARAHSRAEAFRTALARTLFGEVKTSEVVRDSLDVVINATELRTGSAFRFGSRESGCWRFGTIAPASSSVADAVAASAAYPVFLPALDREYRFSKRGKDVGVDRVLLTDGGVFENLGVGPMEPGRSPDVSTNVFDPKYIISCDAGGGLFDADSFPMWWPTRMHRSFLTTFRKVQDATRNRLHRHAATGAISGFAFAYLGQIDESLPWLPPDLPRRHEVYTYPTNFSPMAEADIERLARRGEVLMRELLAYYLPEL